MGGEPQQTVLICGYYGFGNIGDEAILTGILQQLSSLWPKARYLVLSSDPEKTSREHGVEAVRRHDVRSVCTAMRTSTVFIGGGGTLFQDVTSFRSLYYYLLMILAARWYRLPVIIYGQGIGPLRSRWNKFVTLQVLRLSQLIIVRDTGAYEQLLKWGVDDKKLCLGADPVLGLKTPAIDGRQARSQGKLQKDKPVLFVSLRPWPSLNASLPILAVILDRLCEEKAWQVVFVPFQFDVDYPVCKACATLMRQSALVWTEPLAVKDALTFFGEADYCLGMRLHSLIFAALQGVPMLGIAYDPKVEEFLRELGMEELIVPLPDSRGQALDGEHLLSCLGLLEEEKESLANHIGEKLQKLAARLGNATKRMGEQVRGS